MQSRQLPRGRGTTPAPRWAEHHPGWLVPSASRRQACRPRGPDAGPLALRDTTRASRDGSQDVTRRPQATCVSPPTAGSHTGDSSTVRRSGPSRMPGERRSLGQIRRSTRRTGTRCGPRHNLPTEPIRVTRPPGRVSYQRGNQFADPVITQPPNERHLIPTGHTIGVMSATIGTKAR